MNRFRKILSAALAGCMAVSALMMSLMALLVCQLTLLAFKAYLGQSGTEALWPLLTQILFSMLACPPIMLAAWLIRKAGSNS